MMKSRLLIIFGVQLFFSLAAVIYHSHFADKGWPFSTPLFNPGDRFADLTHFLRYSQAFNPYLGNPPGPVVGYFPFAYLAGAFLAKLSGFWQLPLMVGSYVLAAGCLLITLLRSEAGQENRGALVFFGLVFIAYLNDPILFAIDRGNIEVFLFCGFVAVYLNKDQHPWASDFILAMLIAAKGYPAVLLLLHLKQRQWKRILSIGATTVMLEVLALSIYPGSFGDNLKRMVLNQHRYTQEYAMEDQGLAFGHSIWGGIKAVYYLTDSSMNQAIWRTGYTVFILLFVLFCIFLVLKRLDKNWQIWMVIFSITMLLPFVSADYKLIHLLIPATLFLRETEKTNKMDILYAVGFGLIFAPFSYSLWWFNPNISSSIHISIIVTPLILLIMIGCMFWQARGQKIPGATADSSSFFPIYSKLSSTKHPLS